MHEWFRSEMSWFLKKTLGILVPRLKVDQTLRVLRRLQLVDTGLKFSRKTEQIIIPVVREPTYEEEHLLKERCAELRMQTELFVEARTRPRNLQTALQGQIPKDLLSSVPRSLEIIGEIAVVELPEILARHASVVGNGVLRISPHLRLVLRKSGTISGRFRTAKFETIAGNGSTETIYQEFSCRFHFDVATVYFSSKLSHERRRIAQQVGKGECVLDMFAGVGPYSVLIAKMQPSAKVYSIDINPEAFRYLHENILLNQVADRVIPIFGDAREIISSKLRAVASRVVMNLPSDAKSFFDSAIFALKGEGGMIHYYAFASRDQSLDAIKEEVRNLVEDHGRRVAAFPFAKAIREVAPNRLQVAIDVLVK